MADALHHHSFIASILDADVKEYALTSGALARTVYTNEGLSNLQFSTERLVGGFLINGDGNGTRTASCEESPTAEYAEGGGE